MVQIHSPRPFFSPRSFAEGAQDFVCGLRRPQSDSSSNPFAPTILFTEVLRGRRSGFRLRAQTPAKRLKFKSIRPDHFFNNIRKHFYNECPLAKCFPLKAFSGACCNVWGRAPLELTGVSGRVLTRTTSLRISSGSGIPPLNQVVQACVAKND
jgi:hypothetical protein